MRVKLTILKRGFGFFLVIMGSAILTKSVLEVAVW
jgi:hypothetical protein